MFYHYVWLHLIKMEHRTYVCMLIFKYKTGEKCWTMPESDVHGSKQYALS